MVKGLELEFLIPTLGVTKGLEWNGHAFSQRLEEFEQLEELPQNCCTEIYAQKWRVKSFHDAHIINKEFNKGDLMLAYTLK